MYNTVDYNLYVHVFVPPYNDTTSICTCTYMYMYMYLHVYMYMYVIINV